jgi:hypothetical protein
MHSNEYLRLRLCKDLFNIHCDLTPAVNPIDLNLGDFNQTTGGNFLGIPMSNQSGAFTGSAP